MNPISTILDHTLKSIERADSELVLNALKAHALGMVQAMLENGELCELGAGDCRASINATARKRGDMFIWMRQQSNARGDNRFYREAQA